MRWLTSARACLLFAVSLLAAEAKLGLPAPDIPLGAPPQASLRNLRGKKVLVLLTDLPPAGLDKVRRELEQHETEVAIAPGQGADARTIWLIDEQGIVRRIDPVPTSAKVLIALLTE